MMLFTSRNANSQNFNREKMIVPFPLLQNTNIPFTQQTTASSILQEENRDKSHDNDGEARCNTEAVSSTGKWDMAGSGGGVAWSLNWGDSGGWCLDLSIADLGDGSDSAGWGLDLSVGDLSNGGSSPSWCLHLTIRDLRDWCSNAGWCLNLSVRDLRDGRGDAGWRLNLSVADLCDWFWHDGWDLRLAISQLGDRDGGLSLWLSIRDLADWPHSGTGWLAISRLSNTVRWSGAGTWENLEEDSLAVSSP